ncbi:MAG: RDD family protein [Gemmatimonadota bacterium]
MAEVVTGEAVVLDVPFARFPSRLLARALDTLIQFGLLFVLGIVTATAGGSLDPASAAAVGLTVTVLIIVGYPVIWETASRGGTPGKFALGLRVVADDGGPERFRQALVRGLFGFVEIWLLFGFPALLISLLSPEGKRLGDYVAGTRVIQRRLPRPALTAGMLAGVPPALGGWAVSLELSSLRDGTAETARQYLMRYPQLTPQARAELGSRLAGAVAAQVSPPPPPGTPPPDYLAAVLGERSRRAHARLAASAAAPGSGGAPPGAWAPPPAGPVPAPAPPPPGGPASAGGFSPPV